MSVPAMPLRLLPCPCGRPPADTLAADLDVLQIDLQGMSRKVSKHAGKGWISLVGLLVQG